MGQPRLEDRTYRWWCSPGSHCLRNDSAQNPKKSEELTCPFTLKDHPFVFDLLIVRRCALRRCFFLASRASAYLFIAVGEADFFSAFALVSGTVLASELTTGVVLIISSPSIFLTGMPTFLAPVDLSDLRGSRVLKTFSTQGTGGPIQR